MPDDDVRSIPELQEGARSLAMVFLRAGQQGEDAIEWLRGMTMGRVLPAAASDAELRFMEGQRHLVQQIIGLVERVRNS